MLLMFAWHHTFLHMWHRWFPAWEQTHRPLVERLFAGETDYRHGPLVILVSLLLSIRIWHRQPREPLGHTNTQLQLYLPPWLAGYLLLAASLVLHLASTWVGVGFTSAVALVGTLLGMLLIAGGWSGLRQYGPAVGLLLFMVPLPMVWIAQLNFTLKMAAASAAANLIEWITGNGVSLNGARVLIVGPTGLPESLSIDNACSGLRSLIALTWFAAVLAVLCRLPIRWRWMLLALSAPVAFACNVGRIAALIFVAQTLGIHTVADDTPLHALAGLGTFLAALATMLSFEQLVLWVRHHRTDQPGAERSNNTCVKPGRRRAWAFDIGTRHFFAARPLTPAIAGLIVIAAVVPNLSRAAPPAATTEARPLPDILTVAGQRYEARDLAVSDRLRAMLGTPHITYRQYHAPASPRFATRAIDVIWVQHGGDRQAIHPPVVCLEGEGHRIIDQRDHVLTTQPGQTIPMRKLITQRGDDRYVHLYTYRCPSGYTTSYVEQQLSTVLSRQSGSALLRISAAGPDADAAVRDAAAALPW